MLNCRGDNRYMVVYNSNIKRGYSSKDLDAASFLCVSELIVQCQWGNLLAELAQYQVPLQWHNGYKGVYNSNMERGSSKCSNRSGV